MSDNKQMVVNATPKKVAFMSKPYKGNDARIEEDEKELEELEAAQQKEQEIAEKEPDKKADKKDSKDTGNWKKRYGDLRSFSDKKINKLKEENEALKAKNQELAEAAVPLPKTDTELEEWMKSNPDLADVIKTLAIKEIRQERAVLDERFEELDSARRETAEERMEAELQKLHPDIDELRESDDFHDWAEEQPQWVQDALYAGEDVRAAARAIDLYKMDKSKENAKEDKKDTDKELERQAAAAVDTKSESTIPNGNDSDYDFKESEINGMSDAEFDKHNDAIMAAQRTGRILMDVSGAAR